MTKETVKWLKAVGKAAAAKVMADIAKAVAAETTLGNEVWPDGITWEDSRSIIARAFSKEMK